MSEKFPFDMPPTLQARRPAPLDLVQASKDALAQWDEERKERMVEEFRAEILRYLNGEPTE